MALEKSLVSGSTAMLLLKLLSEQDMYGYEMIETLKIRSENVFELKAGTLYPLLHSLEEKGLLTACEKDAGGKPGDITRSPGKAGRCWIRKRRNGRLIPGQL